MSTLSQVYCSRCRKYKPSDQFNQARNGRPYKNYRACYENQRRQPLAKVDPNSRSLRSDIWRPTAPIRQSRQLKRRRLDPIPTVEPTHALVQAGQGLTETVGLTFSTVHALVQALQGPTNRTLSPTPV